MKAKILIIEDDKDIRKNLVVLFSSLEYEVKSTVTAEEALTILDALHPDLIICDINLPNMSGYDFKELLNKNKETFGIPFIFLTARNTYEDLRSGMKLAADDFVFKPYKASDLIQSVELRLMKSRINNNSYEDAYIFVKVNKTVKKILLKNINVILGENQYSKVCQINGKNYLVRKPLNKWEETLPENFVRINRSAIININIVEEITKSSGARHLKLNGFPELVKVTNNQVLEKILNPNTKK